MGKRIRTKLPQGDANSKAPRSAFNTMTRNYERVDMAWIVEDFIRDHGMWDTFLDWFEERKIQEQKALKCRLRGPDLT